MQPEKPTRRNLLDGCLACLLGWFGLGRQPAKAMAPSPQLPGKESQASLVQETRTSYDALGRCIRIEKLQYRSGAEPVWIPVGPSQLTTYPYPS